MIFGERLKKLREENGLTQLQLADITNKSRSTIAGYEINDRLPDLDTLRLISKHFNVSIDWLLGNSNIRENMEDIIADYYPNISEEAKEYVYTIYDSLQRSVSNNLSKENLKVILLLEPIYRTIAEICEVNLDNLSNVELKNKMSHALFEKSKLDYAINELLKLKLGLPSIDENNNKI